MLAGTGLSLRLAVVDVGVKLLVAFRRACGLETEEVLERVHALDQLQRGLFHPQCPPPPSPSEHVKA